MEREGGGEGEEKGGKVRDREQARVTWKKEGERRIRKMRRWDTQREEGGRKLNKAEQGGTRRKEKERGGGGRERGEI